MEMEDANMPKVGDRIKVVLAQPHMPGQVSGTVRQAIHGLLGIEFDNMLGEVHHWYAPTEVMVVTEAAKMPSEMPSDGIRSSLRKPYILSPNANLNALQSEDFKVYVKNATDDEPAELLIYEQIGKDPWFGDGVGAKDVAGFLAQNRGKAVNVRINSPGGLVFDGVTIHNALVQHDAEVVTTIEGIAASAASVIAMAGGKVKMYENASFMMHRAWGVAIGNKSVMEDTAVLLEKLDGQIAATYAAKSGRKKDTMLKMMTGTVDGTWLSASEALAEGLIDEIVPLPKDSKRARNEVETPTDVATEALKAEASRKAAKARAAARLRLMEIES